MLPQDPIPLLPCPGDLGRCPERTSKSPAQDKHWAAQPSAVLVFALFVSRQGGDGVHLLKCSWKEILNLPGLLSLHPETQRLLGLMGRCWKRKLSQSPISNTDILGPSGHWEFAVINPFLNKETEAKRE